MGQERSRNHPHLGKAEVAQALQGAAVESRLHWWKLRRAIPLHITRACPIAMAVSSKKKATYEAFMLKCQVPIPVIYRETNKTLREGDGGTRLYLKFSQKIIALSQNVWSDLIQCKPSFKPAIQERSEPVAGMSSSFVPHSITLTRSLILLDTAWVTVEWPSPHIRTKPAALGGCLATGSCAGGSLARNVIHHLSKCATYVKLRSGVSRGATKLRLQ